MLNDFYTLHHLQQGEGTMQCSLAFNAAHPIFSGHFPGQPVVPGVCTIHIVKALLEAALGQKLLLKESAAVKFLRLMTPESAPVVFVSWEAKGEDISATAIFKDGDVAVFKMNGTYEAVGVVPLLRPNL